MSNLTIVIPTYGRQRYALGQLRFWSNFSYKLLILDGTEIPIDANELKGLAENVQYQHMPYSVVQRFKKAFNLIDTPYVAILGDDEFFIPSSLESCINHLRMNDDLVACMGRCLGFYVLGSEVRGKIIYSRLKNYKIDDASSRERMIKHMNPYVVAPWFSVMKSEVWKENIRILISQEFSCIYVSEIQFELATCYQGKFDTIDELMLLRNRDNPSISTTKCDRTLEFNMWYTDKKYLSEVKQFYNVMSKSLSQGDPNKYETIYKDLQDAINAYLQFIKEYNNWRASQKKAVPKSSGISNSIFKLDLYILKKLPSLLKLYEVKVRDWLKKFTSFGGIKAKNLISFAEELQQIEGVKVDFEQLKSIINIILKFHPRLEIIIGENKNQLKSELDKAFFIHRVENTNKGMVITLKNNEYFKELFFILSKYKISLTKNSKSLFRSLSLSC